MLALGAKFEIPVLLPALGRAGVLSSATLRRHRGYAIVDRPARRPLPRVGRETAAPSDPPRPRLGAATAVGSSAAGFDCESWLLLSDCYLDSGARPSPPVAAASDTPRLAPGRDAHRVPFVPILPRSRCRAERTAGAPASWTIANRCRRVAGAGQSELMLPCLESSDVCRCRDDGPLQGDFVRPDTHLPMTSRIAPEVVGLSDIARAAGRSIA
jgi:hypothetical protein